MAAEIRILGRIDGIPSGSKRMNLLVSTSSPIGAVTNVDLSSGANTITVPTGSEGCVIVPPTANAQTITLKGVTGDTGVALSKVNPTFLTFDATPPASFVLTAGGTIAGVEVSWF